MSSFINIVEQWELVMNTISPATKNDIGTLFLDVVVGLDKELIKEFNAGNPTAWKEVRRMQHDVAITDINSKTAETFWKAVIKLQPIMRQEDVRYMSKNYRLPGIITFLCYLKDAGNDSKVIQQIILNRNS